MSAVLQIVDGVGGSVLMDLNSWSAGALAQRGMNLTAGQLSDGVSRQQDAVWSPLSGPAGLGRRTITLPFVLVGTSVDDVGSKAATLNQLVQAPWWLKVTRHGATGSSYLRCFPCVPQIESQITAESHAHMKQGVIVAETDPYAVGARVDVTQTAIGQDPAGTAWGLDINSVPGDAPTPCLIRIQDSAELFARVGAFVSVRRRGTPSNLTAANLARQAESGSNTYTNGTNIALTTVTGQTALSGSSGVRVTCNSSYVAGVPAQITFAGPALPAADAPGVYRLFVRINRDVSTAAAGGIIFRAYVDSGLIDPEDVGLPSGGDQLQVIDLGLVQWPSGQPLGVQAPVPQSQATPGNVTLQFWRTNSGTAQFDVDWLAWIPADEDAGYLTTEYSVPNSATNWLVVDGYSMQALLTSADPIGAHSVLSLNYAANKVNPTWIGGVPRVGPGTNRLFVLTGLNFLDPTAKTDSLNVAVSYWPRYTWLR